MTKQKKEKVLTYFTEDQQEQIRKAGGICTLVSGMIDENYFRFKRGKANEGQIENDYYIMNGGKIENIITTVHSNFDELFERINQNNLI